MGVFGELTGLGKAFWDVGVSGLDDFGEFVRDTGDLAGLDSLVNVGEHIAGLGPNLPDPKLLRDVTGSEILDAGQLVIEGMRLTTGVGEPENGDRFGQGWSRFNDAGETLTSAFPNDSWAGAGADAYADQNRTQTGRTNTVALLDRGVQTVIAREAYQVSYHRDKLDDQSNFLADLSYMTMALALVPGYGKALKATVEAAAVKAALSICSLELYELSREANQNAAELQQAVDLYAGACKTATRTSTQPPSIPPAPPPGGSPPVSPDHQRPAAPRTRPPTSAGDAPSKPPARAELPETPATPDAAARENPPAPAPADGPGQLAALLAPLGALLAGAAQGAPIPLSVGQPPTALGGVPAPLAKDTATKKKDDDKQEDEENKDTATAGRDEGEAERAPVDPEAEVDPDGPHAPVTATFDPDRPPMPPAATTRPE
jgi:hypothetical protein